MKLKSIRAASIALLLFLGISALFGSIVLFIDPTGKIMGLPHEMLEGIPFSSYLIPGILLGVFNGMLSILITLLVIFKSRLQGWMVVFQGVVLLIWMTAEMFMGMYYPPLTLPYYIVGFLLVLCGILLIRAMHS